MTQFTDREMRAELTKPRVDIMADPHSRDGLRTRTSEADPNRSTYRRRLDSSGQLTTSELLKHDLDEILAASEGDFRRLSGMRLYLTGGTGFVGTWFLRAFAHANRCLLTKIRIDVLTRDPQRFRNANPDLASIDAIRFLRGDVTAPVFDGKYDGVIHAAATSAATVTPSETLRTIVNGTRAIIEEVIRRSGAIPFLFISSGAVYGSQPPELNAIPETYCGELDHLNVRYTYHESKRVAELSLAIAQQEFSAMPKIARLFAFLGPGLPLDAHFAAGNFIRDALAGGPIRINSAGRAIRSYLYPTDMIVWCIAIFSRGQTGRAYNVGSDEIISIRELAQRIVSLTRPPISVEMVGPPAESTETRYTPDVRRITEELGVHRSVILDDAIARTLDFHRRGQRSP